MLTPSTYNWYMHTDPKLDAEVVARASAYATEVETEYGATFESTTRFADGERLLRRFRNAIKDFATGICTFNRVFEAHNELAVASEILREPTFGLARVEYEPPLPQCSKRIDFRVGPIGQDFVFIDVKTIHPDSIDGWKPFQRARHAGRIHGEVDLSARWMGGELWHYMTASRARMLEYTLELEDKIAEIPSDAKMYFVLAFCGDGFRWREDELEDFVSYYTAGRHRSDDHFGRMESHYIRERSINLKRTVGQFACFHRAQAALKPSHVNWAVQAPLDPST
jgi:hypothetical protein